MPQRILVTGGAGFIGSHLATKLIEKGLDVVIVDDLSNGKRENVPDQAVFFQVDIREEGGCDVVFEQGVDAVCHLAAQSSGALSFDAPTSDMQSHVVGTFGLLEACRKWDVRRFLYASSSTIYGEPDSMPVHEDALLQPTMYYSTGKVAAEAYVRFFDRFGINHTIFRMPNVYGPGQNLDNKFQGMISIYLSFMLEDTPISVKGSLGRFRDFIYIKDVVDAWVMALDSEVAFGRTYNLGSGERRTVSDVLDCLRDAWGHPNYPIRVEDGTPGDQSGMVLDVSRIKDELGFTCKYRLEEGIAHMVEIEKKRLG